MALRFPSLEFLLALEKRSREQPASLAAHAEGEALVGLCMDDQTFMIEFENGLCVAAALGGNPNDMDFTLSAPTETWRQLLERIACEAPDSNSAAFEAMVGADADIRVETLQDDGLDRFDAQRPALEAFFRLAEGVPIE